MKRSGGNGGSGSGSSGSSLGDSRAGNAYDILGLGRESFEDAKIRVVVRKRPLSRKEKAREDVDIVDMNEDSHVYLHEPRVKVIFFYKLLSFFLMHIPLSFFIFFFQVCVSVCTLTFFILFSFFDVGNKTMKTIFFN